MYNLVYGFVALLKELDVISEEAYHAFCRELATKILPSNSKDAASVVHDVVVKVEANLKKDTLKVEPWLNQIHALEDRVVKLEAQLTKKK